MLFLGSVVEKRTVLSSDSAQFEVAFTDQQCCKSIKSCWSQKGPPGPEPEPVGKDVKNWRPTEQFRETNTLYMWNQTNTLMVTQRVESTNHEGYSGINLITAFGFIWAAHLLQKHSVDSNGKWSSMEIFLKASGVKWRMRANSAFESFYSLL